MLQDTYPIRRKTLFRLESSIQKHVESSVAASAGGADGASPSQKKNRYKKNLYTFFFPLKMFCNVCKGGGGLHLLDWKKAELLT